MESGPPPKLLRSIEACVEALSDLDALRQAVIGLLAWPDQLARFSVALFELELARKGDEGARQNVAATAERLLEFWHDGSGARLAQSLPGLEELWAKAAATLAAFETRRFAKSLKDCWAARNDAEALEAAMAQLVPEGADRVEFARCLYHLRLAKLGKDASRQEFARRAMTLSRAWREQAVADELIGGDEGLLKLWGVVQPLLKAFFAEAPEGASAPAPEPPPDELVPHPTAPTDTFEVRHETRRLPVEQVPPLASLGSPKRVTIPKPDRPRPSAPVPLRRPEVKTDPALEAVEPPRASPGAFDAAPTAPSAAPVSLPLAPLTNPTPFPSMRAAPPPPAPPPPTGGLGGDGGLFTADLLASALPPPGAPLPTPAAKKPKAPTPPPAIASPPGTARAPTPPPVRPMTPPPAATATPSSTKAPTPPPSRPSTPSPLAPAATQREPAATQLHAAFSPLPGPKASPKPAATQLHAAFSPMPPPAPAPSPQKPAATQLHAAFSPLPPPAPVPSVPAPPPVKAAATTLSPAFSLPAKAAAVVAEPPLLDAAVDDSPLLDAALAEPPSPPPDASASLDEVAVDEVDLIDATFVEATLADTPVMEAVLSTPPGGIQTRTKTGNSFLDLVSIDEGPPVPPAPPPDLTPPGGRKAATLEVDIEEIEPEPGSGGKLPSAAMLLRPSAPPPPPPGASLPPPPPPPAMTPAHGVPVAQAAPPPKPRPSRPQRVSLDLELGPYDADPAALAFWQFAVKTLDLLPNPNQPRVAQRLLPSETREERKVLLDFIGACRPHAQVPDARAFACLLSLAMAGQLKEKTLFGKPNEERTEAFRRALAFLAADGEAAGRAATWFAFDGPVAEHELWQGLDVLISFLAFCGRNELSPLDPKAQATFLRAPPG